MTIVHETIVLERHYDATPRRVFRAFADPEARAMWFNGPDDWPAPADRTFDFRVGGLETMVTGPAGAEPFHYTARFHDIVADQRIIRCYDMAHRGQRISVSVQSVELFPDNGGTRLVLTDQGGYLDGLDIPRHRRRGLELELNGLAKALVAGDPR